METENTFNDLFPAHLLYLGDGQLYGYTPSERLFKNDDGVIRFDFYNQFPEQFKEAEGNTVYYHRPTYKNR